MCFRPRWWSYDIWRVDGLFLVHITQRVGCTLVVLCLFEMREDDKLLGQGGESGDRTSGFDGDNTVRFEFLSHAALSTLKGR